jgi:hypothetical protein
LCVEAVEMWTSTARPVYAKAGFQLKTADGPVELHQNTDKDKLNENVCTFLHLFTSFSLFFVSVD